MLSHSSSYTQVEVSARWHAFLFVCTPIKQLALSSVNVVECHLDRFQVVVPRAWQTDPFWAAVQEPLQHLIAWARYISPFDGVECWCVLEHVLHPIVL